MALNENIRLLRLKKSMTQEGLGELLGVSAQAVSKWEQGITSPDISLLPIIAECFGVTIDSLFQGTPTRKYFGYSGEREELFARYEGGDGTEEDFRRAADAYGEVILSGKANCRDYLCYGILHQVRASKDVEIALYYCRRAIEIGNKQRDLQWMAAHQTLTNLLFKLGRIEEAVAEHCKWCEEEPEEPWAHVAYAYALEKAGCMGQAMTELETALGLDAEDINVLTLAGDLCTKLGRYEEAITYWDKISKESTSITHLFSKAELFAKLGEREKAIRQYEEILKWLEAGGYNMEVEGRYPRCRIKELQEDQTMSYS